MTRLSVAVIGGGMAGASAAAALAPRADVTLLEMESTAGYHATGRSAAVMNETSGTPLIGALARASRADFERPADGSASLLTPRGLLWVSDRHHRPTLDAMVEQGNRSATDARAIGPEEARALVPALRADWIDAGYYEASAAGIDVSRTLDGFLAAARAAGATIQLSHPAIEIRQRSGRWHVRTPTGDLEVDVVVNAAGAWADQIAQRAAVEPIGLSPLRRTAFTMPATDAADWPLVMSVGGDFYFEPEGPGLLVSPADETPVPPSDVRADELDIARAVDALGVATTLVVRGVRHSWAGIRTFAPDRSPVVGRDPDHAGFIWLAGQGGAGIKIAPALARIVAAQVFDDPLPSGFAEMGITSEALSPARFRTRR